MALKICYNEYILSYFKDFRNNFLSDDVTLKWFASDLIQLPALKRVLSKINSFKYRF